MAYDNVYSPVIADLPPQMVSLKEKDDDWKHRCMDTLEQVGRVQYMNNIQLIENYEMVKGRFIYSHYFQNEGYTDFIAQLTREFELPSYLRHYDIISQVINTLVGEYMTRPDVFRIKNMSEESKNEYERTRTDLLLKYVTSKIDAEIAQKLLDEGIDPEKKDFNSPEEKQQYEQLVQQKTQELTPPEVQTYMNTTWNDQAELWAEHQLEFDKQRFHVTEKEKVEFEDMLIADRCFRHFYLTPTGYNQETWNPVQTFFQKSPDTVYIEEGDYVGRIYYLSIPAIIDRFGHLLNKDEIENLQNKTLKDDKGRWNYTAGSEYVFNDYMMPFRGYMGYDIARKTNANLNPDVNSGLPYLDNGFVDGLYSGKYFNERRGLHFVTECYWKSQKKIGKVTYIDPETGLITKKYVDESFIVPDEFVEIDSSFSDSDDVNTVVWTWVNEIWRGVKINLKNTNYGKNLYFDIKPVEFQFKGDLNPYGAMLPVCGQVFSPRNSKSMSLVDQMKPFQIFHNVAMNQLYQIMEREVGYFVVMDVNMFPKLKDWGGENAWDKFMLAAKQLGMAPADTSPANMQGANGNGFLPKEFNFDDTARMMSRMKLAEGFEQMALKQVGFNEYRLGTFAAYSSSGGAEQGKQASYAQTESYYTNFTNYLRRVHTMNLSIAQFVQSQNRDFTIMYSKSDMSREFIKILGTDLLLADLQVRVVNSQEYIRQLETLRQLAIQNNTSGANISDLAEMITSNSPEEIKLMLKQTTQRQQQLEDRDYQLKQQQAQQEQQMEQAKLQQDEQHFQETLQNNLDVVYAKEGSKVINSQDDKIQGEADPAKQQQLQQTASQHQQKMDLDRQKLIADSSYKQKLLALEQAKIQGQLKMESQKVDIAKILKGKDAKEKSK